MRSVIRALLFVIAVVPGGLPVASAVAQAQPPPRRLFLPVAAFDPASAAAERGPLPLSGPDGQIAPATAVAAPGVRVLRGRYVTLAGDLRSALMGGATELELNLFDDTVLVATRQKVETVAPLEGGGGAASPSGLIVMQSVPGALVWVGRIADDPLSTVILYLQDDGVLAGSIAGRGVNYRLSYAGKGVHHVEEVDPTSATRGPDEPLVPGEVLDALAGEVDLDAQSAKAPSGVAAPGIADDGTTIDILVPYTSLARATIPGGTSAMLSMIGLAISQTNTALSNSGISGLQLRLVAAFEVGYYNGTPDLDRDLRRLSTPGDGYWNELEGLREAFGADLVSLIVDRADAFYGGIAWGWVNRAPRQTPASSAFSVVPQDGGALVNHYAFAHEVGHNMGSNHDRLEPGRDGTSACPAGYCGRGAFDYSFGRVARYTGSGADSCNFRTIMAYPTDCSGPCPRLLFYSTPYGNWSRASFCPAAAMGISEVYSNSAFNALSINNTRYTVSNYRPGVIKAILSTPPPGSTLTSSSTTFAWNAGRNATHYELLIGSSGGSYDLGYFTLSSNTVTVNLPADGRTLYVRLWSIFNSSGYGQYTDHTYVAATPSISIQDSAAIEGSSSTTMSFNVRLSIPVAQTVTVSYATADGSALATLDYNAASGVVTFLPFETLKTVTVGIIGGFGEEPNQIFYVNLSSPSGAAIGDAQAVGTIIDDDAPIANPATVYRLLHPSIGAYLFTVYPFERDSAQLQYNYVLEGECCKWFIANVADGRVPLYRLFSSTAGEYFFTIYPQERDNAVAQFGYVYEGVAAYCHPASAPAAPMPWYRLRFGNKHLYTMYAGERDSAIAQYGYTYEGISCYLPPP